MGVSRGVLAEAPSPRGTWPGAMAGPPASSCMQSGGWDSSKHLSEVLPFGKRVLSKPWGLCRCGRKIGRQVWAGRDKKSQTHPFRQPLFW